MKKTAIYMYTYYTKEAPGGAPYTYFVAFFIYIYIYVVRRSSRGSWGKLYIYIYVGEKPMVEA